MKNMVGKYSPLTKNFYENKGTIYLRIYVEINLDIPDKQR